MSTNAGIVSTLTLADSKQIHVPRRGELLRRRDLELFGILFFHKMVFSWHVFGRPFMHSTVHLGFPLCHFSVCTLVTLPIPLHHRSRRESRAWKLNETAPRVQSLVAWKEVTQEFDRWSHPTFHVFMSKHTAPAQDSWRWQCFSSSWFSRRLERTFQGRCIDIDCCGMWNRALAFGDFPRQELPETTSACALQKSATLSLATARVEEHLRVAPIRGKLWAKTK